MLHWLSSKTIKEYLYSFSSSRVIINNKFGRFCPSSSCFRVLKFPVDPNINKWEVLASDKGVTLAQLVKTSVGQADIQRFELHLGHNLLSCGMLLVKSRHFGLPLAQTIRPNWQSLLAGGSVAIQTWSIYKVYT